MNKNLEMRGHGFLTVQHFPKLALYSCIKAHGRKLPESGEFGKTIISYFSNRVAVNNTTLKSFVTLLWRTKIRRDASFI